MQKITDNVYVETGFAGCNTGFITTKEGVVLIDTPQLPKDAVAWREEIAKHGKIRYLINTEPHGDHISGNCFFDGTLVTHEGTRDAILACTADTFRERLEQSAPDNLPLPEGLSYRPPAITLSQRMTIYLGDHTFQLTNHPGHTPYQVAVYIPEERVVFTSDNIFHKILPHLRETVPYEWLESLKKLQELDADVLVPGHGTVCDKSYIPEMSAVIQEWIDVASAAIAKGMSVEEAQETITLYARYLTEGEDTTRPRQIQDLSLKRLYQVLKK
ncbi:MBL fold metallo-hydrolase [Chloroflexota bacterium]